MKNWTGIIRDLIWLVIIVAGVITTFIKLDGRVSENAEGLIRNRTEHADFTKRFDVLTRMEERLIYMQRDIEELKQNGK